MNKFDVAAYVWPSYTGDEPRALPFWPDGYGEWETVRAARPKYDGHSWPRKPLWGYVNEADPYVMEAQIEAAADHDVNVFIYDWYWYDDRPFLEQCLADGFLKARNRNKMQFYLMWANHDATFLWDRRLSSGNLDKVIWNGFVNRPVFETIGRRCIERFFCQPNYYRIDGKPVYMIYDAKNFIKGFGGVGPAGDALEWFRHEAAASGFPGLHLQMCYWNDKESAAALAALGFDSVTHYQFVHFTDVDRDYGEILQDAQREWERLGAGTVPYFPHVSAGWDANPRFRDFVPGVVKGNTPDAFEQGLRMAKAFAEARPSQPPLVTINSWNEWTEASYLQPDDIYGYGYLEAVRRVFNPESPATPHSPQ